MHCGDTYVEPRKTTSVLLALFVQIAASACGVDGRSAPDACAADNETDGDTDAGAEIEFGEATPFENEPRGGEVCVPGGNDSVARRRDGGGRQKGGLLYGLLCGFQTLRNRTRIARDVGRAVGGVEAGGPPEQTIQRDNLLATGGLRCYEPCARRSLWR